MAAVIGPAGRPVSDADKPGDATEDERGSRVADAPSADSTGNELGELALRAADGDRGALGELLVALNPVITRYCRARIGRRRLSYHSADDVAQEVRIAIVNALPRYPDKGGPFLYLVYAIASNKVADAFRAASRDRLQPVPELPESQSVVVGPESDFIGADTLQRLGSLVRTLPAIQQEVLVLRLIVGFSAVETAEAVGLTPGNVRTVQHRGLTKLRALIGKSGDF